MTMTTK